MKHYISLVHLRYQPDVIAASHIVTLTVRGIDCMVPCYKVDLNVAIYFIPIASKLLFYIFRIYLRFGIHVGERAK